jgi:predicted ATPase
VACYVVSGCSSSGKSTLLDALAARGVDVVPEPGRQIVRDELRAGGDGLPWRNAQRFLELCAARALADLAQWRGAARPVFFDRSFIDAACAIERSGLEWPPGLRDALVSERYARTVFMSAPWPELFVNDAERRGNFADAVAEYDALVPFYRAHGYRLVPLPQVSVAERVDFVLATVSSQ